MKEEMEILANEVRQLREKAIRPRYSPELIARVIKLMGKHEIGVLAARIGIGKETLRRWQKNSQNKTRTKPVCGQLTFSPVVPERPLENRADKISNSEQMIRLDFSYRDGRRLVLELPATNASCQDLLASLRQEFFRGR